jgi:methanogenic corrinoid protein MtbC1
MVGDVFLSAGFEPIELGADVPLASLESAIHRVDRLKAVGIGAVVSNRKHLAAAVRRARRAAGPGIPIILGGPGTNRDEAIGLGADGWAATATDGVDMLEACLRGEKVGVRSVAATTPA